MPAITTLLFVRSSILADAISAEVATSNVLTSKSPAISTSVGNPIVTVLPDAAVSISLAVPAIVNVSSGVAAPVKTSIAIVPESPATDRSMVSINSLTPWAVISCASVGDAGIEVSILVTTCPVPPDDSSASAPILISLRCLLASNITALLAVAVPCTWSNIWVKYLPPIRSTEAETPPVSVPVPIYNLSPLLACVPVTYEYANSPVLILLGAVVVDPVVNIFILVNFVDILVCTSAYT